MSPVDWAGSVTEISPRPISFVKVLMCSYAKAGGPGYRDLRNRARNFPIRTSQPGHRDEDFSSAQVTVKGG